MKLKKWLENWDLTDLKIAVVVLNQVVRPFTAKWHKLVKED